MTKKKNHIGPADRENRIFWLGMHVVLTTTELPALRRLGYEVYNPPYKSSIYDQSARMDWDKDQPTTLPPIIFKILSEYNFFYNKISPEIAEILNEYFDTVIVTINLDWLESVLRVFKGKVIYRTYGQPFSLSQGLLDRKSWKNLMERDDFHIVSFAEETIEDEHAWFRGRCRIVPYTLPLDIFQYKDTWASSDLAPEIMVNIPNIKNDYYRGMYNHLNVHFPERHFRIYGVQPEIINDLRVVGTLRRDDLLWAYQRSRGCFYPYHDRNVCYLPPIEMMTIGGPVVYASNSLLHRFFQTKTPGLTVGYADQKKKLDWVLKGDQVFIDEVISAQDQVRWRYDPVHVNPIFESVFSELLGDHAPTHKPLVADGRRLAIRTQRRDRQRVWILAHFPGQVFRHERGHAFASEGIPRVIGKVVEGLMVESEYDVTITCYNSSVSALYDFFLPYINEGRLSLHVLDATELDFTNLKPDINTTLNGKIDSLDVVVQALSELNGGTCASSPVTSAVENSSLRLALVNEISQSVDTAAVMVPHYYLFPEALLVSQPLVLYLPDYTPHFFKTLAFDQSLERDQHNAVIGRLLSDKASAVLTNSEFTRGYLPECVLNVDPAKIHCVPMPLLVGASSKLANVDRDYLEAKLGGWQYVFYPTANRPNKQISLLLNVFAETLKIFPDLRLVLTCALGDYPPAEEAFQSLDIAHAVVFLPGVSDATMNWLYRNASALCLTSTMEGNMPPQVLEALTYETPIVATRLPQITEVLKAESHLLQLPAPLSIDEFVEKLTWVLTHPDETLTRQKKVRQTLEVHNNMGRFSSLIADLFRDVAQREAASAPTATGVLSKVE